MAPPGNGIPWTLFVIGVLLVACLALVGDRLRRGGVRRRRWAAPVINVSSRPARAGPGHRVLRLAAALELAAGEGSEPHSARRGPDGSG